MTHGQLARQGQSIGFTSIYFYLCEKWKIPTHLQFLRRHFNQ